MFVMLSLLTISSSHRQLEFLDGSCGLNRRWAPCAHASILLPLLSFGACGVCAHRWDGARRNSDAAAWMCGVGSGSSPAGRRSGATLAPTEYCLGYSLPQMVMKPAPTSMPHRHAAAGRRRRAATDVISDHPSS
uniref:Uncharacterized protein n=1 Tax=Triticum urartu TaxID=4572 RepID=A0A8R7TD76_TRIUA